MNVEKQNILDKNRKRKGIIATISIHLLLIASFVLFGFKTPDEKQSTILTIGTQETTKPIKPSLKQQSTSVSKKANDTKKLFKDDLSKVSVPISNKKTKKKVANHTSKGVSNHLLNISDAYRRKAIPGENTEPNKIARGPNSINKKKSKVSKYDISGRKAMNLGTQKNSCGISGTVVIKISVNQYGTVTEAIHIDGTTSNKCLINQAKIFAKQIKYAPSKIGESIINEGKITIKGSLI